MKRTPLRRVSKKRAKELVIYRSLKKYILSQRPYCEMISQSGIPSCLNYATQIHHSHGRGKLLNEVKFWWALCTECHAWIHDHAREARAKGLLK